jgi:ABC-type amino acid transport substrate-binding protein
LEYWAGRFNEGEENMRCRACGLAVALLATWMAVAPARSQAPGSGVAPARPLVVGTKATEPFVLRDADGEWTGISIELWEKIAGDLGWDFEYRELGLADLIDATRNGSVDAAVAAFTVTSEREEVLDFSHTFYSTGLGLAVASPRSRRGLGILRAMASRQFLSAVTGLSLLLLVVGSGVWLFERRRNKDEFGGSALEGVGSGFWWSAVTMTTVGYGDKSPRTFGGRALALVWMFACIVMISTFTATITSSLTLTRLQSSVQGPDDLPHVRVGTLEGSAPATSLENRDVSHRGYPDLDSALRALSSDDVDVVVYDEPILRYHVKERFQGEIAVLPRTFESQVYAIMFPSGSALREPINRALLRVVRSPQWQDVLQRYLGD